MQKILTLLALLALLAGLSSLPAQTETGQLTGTISDPTGAAIPAATVTVRSLSTSSSRTFTTSSDGTYNITNLLPGEYSITVKASGFAQAERRVTVTVGSRVGRDFQMEVSTSTTIVEVAETAGLVNTETQTLSQVVDQSQLRELPNLTRNAYQFVALAGNISDAGMGTRGAGFSINGQRESSTNILLDGASNNNEFGGSIGQQVPLDAVQEFSVLTSNFTAEYGRASGGVVNVVSKAGSNDFHGTAYEFNRVSRLSSNTFQNNATGQPRSVFTRNQFGYSVGGPAVKNKLFFFSSTEWIRVRSAATNFAWVPTADFLSLTPANTQNFFSKLGQLRAGANVIGTASRSDLAGILGADPCAGQGCATLPMNLPVFKHVAYNVPTDSGGGYPQDTYMTTNRVDYNLSERTQIYGRYSLYSEEDTVGSSASSPYADYDLGQSIFNQNFMLSVIHTLSPRWVSQSKAVYNRLSNLQPGITSRGLVPTMYPNATGPVAIGSDNIAFPGYYPFTPGNGGAFGGPQNLVQLYEDVSYTRGTHSFRFGGTYVYQRDNRTFAAYQTAVDSLAGSGLGPAMSALMAGTFNRIKVAIDPQGHYPCANASAPTADCMVTLPLGPPNFSRSNRYHELALYAQDAWKLRPRLTLNLGLRWEYFGVQHNKNPQLDSNWYASGVSDADSNLGAYLRSGIVTQVPKSPIGSLWNPRYANYAPRVGVAWDVFGDGRTSLRAGYGIGYERNFGNVTFNLMQNPPNYAVLDAPGPITTDNFGPLAGSSGSMALPRVGARIVNPDIKTAHAHMWNLSFQHQLMKGATWSIEYSGSKGVDLYSISYPNQNGFGNSALGDACTGLQDDGSTDCASQPNSRWGVNVGYRGNQAFSIYHGLNNRLALHDFMGSGVDLTLNYTWSHAIDNLSSTFFEAAGAASQYGNANVTINNGNFYYGLMDPFHPNLDRGDAEFDIRQRVALAAAWRIPSRATKGWQRYLLSGWSLTPMFVARSGQPYSVFDSSVGMLPLNVPRASFNGAVSRTGNGMVATPSPNTYQYLTFTDAQIARTPMSFKPGVGWPSNMSGRDIFRSPGWFNLDLGLNKDLAFTERVKLQLRVETFNLFNHANLYVVGASADLGYSNFVTACYGCSVSTYDRRHLQLGAKLSF